MEQMKHGSFCPKCRRGQVQRVRRQDWMHWLPKSKHYRCKACHARFLTCYGWVMPLLKKPSKEKD